VKKKVHQSVENVKKSQAPQEPGLVVTQMEPPCTIGFENSEFSLYIQTSSKAEGANMVAWMAGFEKVKKLLGEHEGDKK
jgi:hypothetical protein